MTAATKKDAMNWNMNAMGQMLLMERPLTIGQANIAHNENTAAAMAHAFSND